MIINIKFDYKNADLLLLSNNNASNVNKCTIVFENLPTTTATLHFGDHQMQGAVQNGAASWDVTNYLYDVAGQFEVYVDDGPRYTFIISSLLTTDDNFMLLNKENTYVFEKVFDDLRLSKSLLKLMYPVNAVLEFGTDVDPNNLPEWSGIDWAWERFAEGLTTVGYKAGDPIFGTIGAEPGSRNSVAVSHAHAQAAHTHSVGIESVAHTHYISGGSHNHNYGYRPDRAAAGSARYTAASTSYSQYGTTYSAHTHSCGGESANHTHSVTGGATTTGYAGVDGTNRNIQPSKVTAKWIRTR